MKNKLKLPDKHEHLGKVRKIGLQLNKRIKLIEKCQLMKFVKLNEHCFDHYISL
jgi:hypothetical protein